MKNTISLVVFLWGWCFCLSAGAQNRTQQITALQYYFNIDPGAGVAGNGAVISVTPDSVFNQTVSMVIPANLPEGLHTLFVRVKDEWNRWSVAERRVFYVFSSLINDNITAYQYYFNTDPGTGIAGNGAIINIGSVNQFNAPVSIVIPPSLSTGIHTLYVRARDVSGQWSQVERRVFYINNAKRTTLVTGLEYYFDVDPGIGNANPFPVTAGNPVNILASIGVPCLSTGTHYLYIRARDEFGQWSIIDRDTLTITSGVSPSVLTPTGPLSLCLGDSVLISSTPIAGATWQWQRNGIDIPGATSFQYYADTAGSYSLKTSCGVSFTISSAVVVNQFNSLTWYADADGDGFGNAQIDSSFCFAIPGWVNDSNDCEDADVNRYPGAAEVCNLVDDDCDGMVDEGLLVRFYADADGDGFGNVLIDSLACQIPSGFVADSLDCDDANALINPGVTEVCINGIDENCNQQIDEGPALYAGPDQEVCADSTVISVAGGNNRNSQLTQDPFSGYWSVISGGGIIADSTALATIVRQLPPGRSVFRFTSVQDSCVGFDDVEVFSIPKPVLSISGLPDSICLNSNAVSLRGLPSGGVFSGVGVTGNLFNPQLVGIQQIRYTTPPNYGCPADTVEQEISVLELPSASIQANSGMIICENGSLELSVISSSSNIEWNTGSTQTTINVIDSGFYSVTVFGANGCINKDSVIITKELRPVISSNGPSIICPGESLQLTYSGMSTVLWSTTQTTATITVTPALTTKYFVNATSAIGCTYSDSILVTVNALIPPTVVTNMLPANNSLNVSLPINLSWFPGANTSAYDLYLWPSTSTQPLTPFASNITTVNFPLVSGVAYGITYNWQVVSKNGNCFSTIGPIQSFSTRSLPDLTVSAIQAPLSVFSGQNISVSWQVNNIGGGNTINTQWSDAVYLSLDTIWQPFDIYIGANPNTSALNSGQAYSSTANYTIPQNLSGNYYVIAKADRFLQLLESNESNNQLNSSAPLVISIPAYPDLRVSSVITPNFSFSNAQANITYTVKNFGGIPTTGNGWFDRIYVSDQPFLNLQNTPPSYTYFRSQNLSSDSTYSVSVSINMPVHVFGPHYVYVFTDYSNRIFEGVAENNNQNSNTLQLFLTPPPDITVSRISVPLIASSGQSIPINWTVVNQGLTETDAQWSDRVYLTSDGGYNLNNAMVLGTVAITDTLSPSQSYSRSTNSLVPDVPAGNYHIYVKTDAFDQLFEYTSKSNNVRKSDSVLVIRNPDLLVDSISHPLTATAGGQINISWRVRNSGAGDVFNRFRKDFVFLHSGASFNINTAILVDSVMYTESISSGALRIKQRTINIPNNINGNYRLFVFADRRGNILEESETNNVNVAGSVIAISLTAWADLQGLSFSLPDTIETVAPFNGSYSSVNAGLGNAAGTWLDSLFVSKKSTWHRDSAVFIRGYSQTQFLNPAASYTQPFQEATPLTQFIPNGADSSTYYFYLKTDATNTIFENTDENNNIFRSNSVYLFNNYVDHIVSKVEGADTGSSGRPYDVEWTVVNNGGINNWVYYNQWRDVILLSTDSFPNPTSIIVGTIVSNNVLAKGQHYTERRTFNLPNGISGNFYLIAYSNYYNQISGERNRNNNFNLLRDTSGIPLTIHVIDIPSPDLKVTSVIAPGQGIAGQPLTVSFTVQNLGPGAAYPLNWQDALSLTTSVNQTGVLLGNKNHVDGLNPNNSYSDSITVSLPITASGNYYLRLSADHLAAVYEDGIESNNIVNSLLTVVLPPPSDLYVSAISVPDSVTSGKQMTVNWTLNNIGTNPATGFTKEGLYFSKDSIWDINDPVFGVVSNLINIPPGGSAYHTLTTAVNSVPIGYYYILIRADLQNNIPESNETNNNSISATPVYVDVKELPLNVLVPDTLLNAGFIFYKVEIPDSLEGATLLVTLNGADLNWANEIYASLDKVPTRSSFDYTFSNTNPNAGDQVVVIPVLSEGVYYITVYGRYTTGGANPPVQAVTLKAEILPFAIRTVSSSKGGNTGNVTVKIEGSKFIQGMTAKLLSTTSSLEIMASTIYYINATTIFATFALNQQPLGIYDVQLRKPDNDTASLSNGFEIQDGNSGGFYVGGASNSGITGSPNAPGCSPGAAAGINSQLQFNVNSPATARIGDIVPMSILYGNAGNVDIPVPTRILVSTGELPIARTIQELSEKKLEIFLEFTEPGGPPGMLRAGSTGTLNFYVRATELRRRGFKLR